MIKSHLERSSRHEDKIVDLCRYHVRVLVLMLSLRYNFKFKQDLMDRKAELMTVCLGLAGLE